MRADVCFYSCVNCRRTWTENAAAILIANCTSWYYFEAKRRLQLIFVGTFFSTLAGRSRGLGFCPKGLVQLERQPLRSRERAEKREKRESIEKEKREWVADLLPFTSIWRVSSGGEEERMRRTHLATWSFSLAYSFLDLFLNFRSLLNNGLCT